MEKQMGMVERVARAIYRAQNPYGDPDDPNMGGGFVPWRQCLPAARAALEAMRGAAPFMIAAVLPITHGASKEQKAAAKEAVALLPPVPEQRRFQGVTAAEDVARDWDRMIDAALAEGEEG
ncbi:hypothetical protein LB518_22640 [Mesorhizobium sp. BR1-1-16]|uniref:hypothetical protein n=1 Tax=Mesorhizobium sp. BR1-1-16 TaxID=2876653 RepID=UPI001CCD465A|nr:hypothetical protein [Mesorhizobium sp. BR1-1-16]MBZ9939112.1 hypothetical protein [Mesorhizobium sp. BR1-1-16]